MYYIAQRNKREPGERQRKRSGTPKEQDRYKRHPRGRTGAHERSNRETEDIQQRPTPN